MLLILVIVLSCIAIVSPLFFLSNNTSDVWKHVNAAQHYNGRGIPQAIKNIVPEPQFSYPWFSSYLIYLTRPKDPNKLGALINVSVLLGACFITSALALHELDRESQLLFCAIVLCNPVWIGPWSGTYSLNTRVTGAVFTNIFVFLFCGPSFLSLEVKFLLATALSFSLIFISKFAVQAALFFSIIYASLFQNLLPFLTLLSGSLITIVMSGGRSLDIIRGHVMHSVFYAEFAQFNTVALNVRRTSFKKAIASVVCALRKRSIDIKPLAYNAQSRLFIWNPQILIIVFIAVTASWSEGGTIAELLKPVAIGLALAFVVDIKGLRFLGEPDRYFYFISLYCGAAYIATKHDIQNQLWIYVPYFSACLAIMTYMIKARFKGEVSFEIEEKLAEDAVRSINWVQADKGETVLVNPSNLSDRFACISGFRYVGVHCQVSWDRTTWPIYKRFFKEGYPTISLSADIKNDFNVKALLVDKSYYQRDDELDRLLSSCDVAATSPEFENQKYLVYRVSE